MSKKVPAASQEQIANFLKDHKEWSLSSNKLYRKFKFKDFKDCLAFMNQVGAFAEEKQHHPEWYNVYNNLEIWLQTHDSEQVGGGLTHKDFALATHIDLLFNPI